MLGNPHPPATCRAATTNRPLRGRLSGNTSAGRRVRDLYLTFVERMGQPSDPLSQAACLHAAELAVAVEQQRLAAARGDAVDVDGLVRLSNLAARAVRALGIADRKPAPTGPTLKEYLAAKA